MKPNKKPKIVASLLQVLTLSTNTRLILFKNNIAEHQYTVILMQDGDSIMLH